MQCTYMQCTYLIEFEKLCGLGPVKTAALLGVSYSTYAQYRSGKRELSLYHRQHIRVLKWMGKAKLKEYIDDVFEEV